MRVIRSFLLLLLFWNGVAAAQGFRPPVFIGGVPGMSQFQAIQMQRHQARTLLYREALAELRRNPAIADVPVCPSGGAPVGVLCLAPPAVAPPKPENGGETAERHAAAKSPETGAPAVTEAPVEAKATVPEIATIRRRLAVLVGNNDYKQPIPQLETPIADVVKIAEVLKERFGFEPLVLKNVGKDQIIEALNQVAAEAQPEDSVLLFYAGHGYLMNDIKMGFWIPVDASVKTAGGWISNADISKLLSAIKARQLILVSDSCYSGSLVQGKKVGAGGTASRDEVLRRRSVLVMSSGDDEPVSDEGLGGHSIFAWNLIKTLEAVNGSAPGFDVYKKVRSQVMKDYPQQPQYGVALAAGHDAGGEYLFDTAGAAAAQR